MTAYISTLGKQELQSI